MSEINPYDALQVLRFTSDQGVLKQAYRRQAGKYHTDRPDKMAELLESALLIRIQHLHKVETIKNKALILTMSIHLGVGLIFTQKNQMLYTQSL